MKQEEEMALGDLKQLVRILMAELLDVGYSKKDIALETTCAGASLLSGILGVEAAADELEQIAGRLRGIASEVEADRNSPYVG